MKLFICRAIFFFAMMLPPLAFAQNLTPDGKQPLEITADQTLEWHRNDSQFIAKGNVVAKQGETSIKSDRLTARYRDTAKKSFDIYEMVAEGNVAIVSRGSTANGDKAVYEVDKSLATLTGKNLKLTSPGQIVTADKFEYHVDDGMLVASGHAVAIRGEDRIEAASMSATFSKQDGSKEGDAAAAAAPGGIDKNLQKLEASGGVTITTPAEVLTGDRASYSSADNIARLTGHVKITHGPNILEGDSAEVNLATNISTMHGGGAQNGGRVRGVFYPDTISKEDMPGSSPLKESPPPEGEALLNAPSP
jgi:lipopolysaccharide export system protein LptA